MKSIALAALALSFAPQLARAANEDCGCSGNAPAKTAAPTTAAPATPLVLAPSAEKVLLRLKLVPGQKYVQQFVMDMRSTTVAKTTRQTTTQKMSMIVDNEVLSVTPEGNTEVRTTYRDLKMAMKMADASGKDLAISNQLDAQIKPIFNAMRGKSISVTYSPRAQLLKTAGMKELVEAIFQAIPAKTLAERASIQAMGKSLVDGMTGNQGSMSKMAAILPEKPVEVGESWQHNLQAPVMNYQMTTKTVYAVESLVGQVLHARVKSDIALKNSGDAKKNPMLMTMTGTQSGTLDLDMKSGLSKSSTLKTYMTQKISRVSKGKPDPNFNFTVYTTGTLSFTTSPITQ